MGRWAPPEVVIEAIGGGEAPADKLIRTIWPACFRLAASVLGDLSLAQDAAQESCVIVHQKITNLRSFEAFDTWLYRIVIREAARVRRRNRTQVADLYTRGFESSDTASMDVWAALKRLSPALREATVLFYFDDLKSEEIAVILNIPHATVRTRLARARECLRELLGDYSDTAPVARREVNQDVS
ncbi:MAG: RNA polymerase sigma factor [Candidatus Eremiobacteraeota bacterium]|nr:RNA polymerase sigma factor [Candidatus Eremiobacteraeota bacterium]